MKYSKLIFAILLLLPLTVIWSQEAMDAKEIIRKADKKTRGESSTGEMTMSIIRPSWTREVKMKSWTKGDELSLILITSPAREKGTAFLKREREIWNWQPTIDRVIKLPPSMMMQSWMGSDFTNDDLVKESSILEDYEHELLGKEEVDGRLCFRLELIPKEDAPVVWGKILVWIDTEEYMQLKSEFYDEDGYLINTMLGKEVKKLGNRILPSKLIVIPADEPDHRTVIEYQQLAFDAPIKENFFSVQNMRRVR